MKLSNIKKIRGQGMTEYLIIVALIAVAAITVFGLFGGAARSQIGAIATEVGGGDGASSINTANTRGGDAVTDAEVVKTMNNYENTEY